MTAIRRYKTLDDAPKKTTWEMTLIRWSRDEMSHRTRTFRFASAKSMNRVAHQWVGRRKTKERIYSVHMTLLHESEIENANI